jgi:integrase/recombinase XerD
MPRKLKLDLPDNALSRALREFLESGEARGIAEATTRLRDLSCRRFILWCEERGLSKPTEITLPILERYQRHLYHYRKPNGEPLSFSSQYAQLVPIRAFFAWLTRARHILYNPASELQLPKVMPNLARYVLSVADIENILSQPDISTLLGIRDRTMMEVLYSSAIRRTELRRLLVFDVDTKKGTLLVREGKGRKDRMVPLGSRACAWVDKYLLDVRPELLTALDDNTLFLTLHGEAFTDYALGDTIKGYIAKAGIQAQGSCHLFRHACATHMLENGADTRYIQALLGHSDLSSTQIYTHVAIHKLKEIHAATHPAKMERQGSVTADSNDQANTLSERNALLSVLVAESEEEEGGDVDENAPRRFLRRQAKGPRRRDGARDEDADADA